MGMGVDLDRELLVGLIAVFATVYGVTVASVYTVFRMLREDIQKHNAKLDAVTETLHDYDKRIAEVKKDQEHRRWSI